MGVWWAVVLLAAVGLHGAEGKYRTGDFEITLTGDSGAPKTTPQITTKDGIEVWTGTKNWLTLRKEAHFYIAQDQGNFVTKLQGGDLCETGSAAPKLSAENDQVTLRGQLACGLEYSINFTAHSSGLLNFTLETGLKINHHLHKQLIGNSYYKVPVFELTGIASAYEHIFGLGTQYTYLDMKGRNVPAFVQEQGVGRGLQPLTGIMNEATKGGGGNWHTQYGFGGFSVSTANRSVALYGGPYAEFDFTQPKTTTIRQVGGGIHGGFVVADGIPEMVTEWTGLVGRMRPLPNWADSGFIMGFEGGSKKLRGAIATMEQQAPGIPLTGVWCQDWTGLRQLPGRLGLWWDWELDPNLYTNWSVLISDLNHKGIHMTTYINPMLADKAPKWSTKHYYAEGLAKGYFIKIPSGVMDEIGSVVIDFTNPEAREWYIQVFCDNLLSDTAPVWGWMSDFGEAVPLDAELSDASIEPMAYHNLYPQMWQEVNQEAVRRCAPEPDQVVYWSRSNSPFSPAHSPLFWLGDQLESWDNDDGLASAITGMQTVGLSGFAITHFDAGGYTDVKVPLLYNYTRSKELLLRSSEAAAFSPVFRSHPGSRFGENWQPYSTPETAKAFGRLAKLFLAWRPYRRHLMEEHQQTGLPIIRPLVMHYPYDTPTYTARQQYMIGPSLFVAPVVTKGATSVRAYVPAGTWMNLWKGTTFASTGDMIDFPAPMGCPALWGDPSNKWVQGIRQEIKSKGLAGPCA